MATAKKIDVLAGIVLAARDCTAQGNQQAANELLDIKHAVAQVMEAAQAVYRGEYHDPERESSMDYRARRLDERERLRKALIAAGAK
jgi:DNA topoisomerase IB